MYSSHNDEARVVRRVGTNAAWTALNIASCEGYAALETAGFGAALHPVGCLLASSYNDDPYFDSAHELMHQFPQLQGSVHSPAPAESFNHMALPGVQRSLWEGGPAGRLHIPTALAAQEAAFLVAGGVVVDGVATAVRGSNGAFYVDVDGAALQADRVVVATGAFVNDPYPLLPTPVDVVVKSETVVLARLSGQEAARLQGLPALLWEVDDTGAGFEGVYCTGVCRHTDGRWYMKLGANLDLDEVFRPGDGAAVRRWFDAADTTAQLAVLTDVFCTVFPGVEVEEFRATKCIITRSAEGQPILRTVEDGLVVVTAGNGYGAMASDGVGAMAAREVLRSL